MLPDNRTCRSRFHRRRSYDGSRRSFHQVECAIMRDRPPSGRVWIERTKSTVQRVEIKTRGGAVMKTALGEQRVLYNSPNGEDGFSGAIPLAGTCLSGTKPMFHQAANGPI